MVSEDISDKEVAKLRKRGIEPVIVKHLDESGTPFLEDIQGQEDKFGRNGRRRNEVSKD